jgi:hypothetical protein
LKALHSIEHSRARKARKLFLSTFLGRLIAKVRRDLQQARLILDNCHQKVSSMQYPAGVREDPNLLSERSRAGLCANCVHARRIESARGSIFYLCERSASDPAFPKYPQLPVIECSGHTTKT